MTVRTEVLIIGAGMSGIAQAVELAKSGTDFLVLEKAHDIGGTWRDNTYPGAACDVESHLYSYSYDQNPFWSSAFAGQREILDYLRGIARRRGLLPRIRLGTEVTGARWDDDAGEWTVSTAEGPTYVSRFLVLGVGGLHAPRTPDLPGAETFRGEIWHSARWNHDVELTGKRVALVGVGASGVQIVPELADTASSLTIFQRTAPWVLPKADAPVPAWRQRLFRRFPLAQSLHRLRIYLRREQRGIGFHHRPEALRSAEPLVRRHIESHIDDPQLRDKLVPAYRLGCKRVLFSNAYYPALNRPHVHVVNASPVALRPDAVVDEAGHEHKTDVIVFATGFDLVGSFDRITIEGTGGRLLKDAWRTGPYAYNGVAVPGFPNMFILLGPTSVVAYTGVVANIEAQTRYVVRAIRATRSAGARALVVRPEAAQRFQHEIRTRFQRTVWHTGGCQSWYKNGSASGTVLWPDSTLRYRMLLRTLHRNDFHFIPARAGTPRTPNPTTPHADRHPDNPRNPSPISMK
ncbi:flavin-containing monooxygenase [Saccharopolyspora phatthalungensis]|uniref:Cyclohexanone monooxygenase n=1 Tax=Saccharopolyspora phatthalungensis TaxID=664693 RepID=A0A840Q718_9PSEU|nr:NAD(P)/FAD-dependent oxidoreductase [Saccharopolyspora phatthalungensis]MBB5156454.1 cyclohexanone monooxygenase [Saccharopolyspora phatthalungensis]